MLTNSHKQTTILRLSDRDKPFLLSQDVRIKRINPSRYRNGHRIDLTGL